VVDAANPRVLQQIASVGKIIDSLHFGEIPQLIVLNKTDLLSGESVKNLSRQIMLDTGAECVSISAIHKESLRPMMEKIGETIKVSSYDFEVSGLTENELAHSVGRNI
jgi:50S ribosomal subunit-associated GTPase HflX